MTFQPKHKELLKDEKIRRWWENNRARSPLSADVLLRNIGLYCEINNTSPERILKDAESGELKRQFSDFVRKMKKEGKIRRLITPEPPDSVSLLILCICF